MNGQGAGAETIPFSVAVKAQGNIEDWLCDLLFKMQVNSKFMTFMYFRVDSAGLHRHLQNNFSMCWSPTRMPRL